MKSKISYGVIILTVLWMGAASSQTPVFDSGSTGINGALNANGDMLIQLPTDGILNYTTINVDPSATVRFIKPTDGNPVVHLLASGDVVVDGTVDVSGAPGFGNDAAGGPGGPGGFDGGTGRDNNGRGGNGQGPGGGFYRSGFSNPGTGGTYATSGTNNPTATYGTPELLPLIGGSGGGGSGGGVGTSTAGGGGGGGINIASSGNLTLNGMVLAEGGGNPETSDAGAGSGGAVRLIANSILGSGTISAEGGTTISGNPGGKGRIRLEAFTVSTALFSSPGASRGLPGPVRLSPLPTLRIVSVGGASVPASPTGRFPADVGVPGGFSNPVNVNLEASNIPLNTQVTVRLVPEIGFSTGGNVVEFLSSPLSGGESASAAIASVTMPTSGRGSITAFIDMVSPLVTAKGTGAKIRVQTGAAGETTYYKMEGENPVQITDSDATRIFK